MWKLSSKCTHVTSIFETGSHSVARASLELTVQFRLFRLGLHTCTTMLSSYLTFWGFIMNLF